MDKKKLHIGVYRKLGTSATDDELEDAVGFISRFSLELQRFYRFYAENIFDIKTKPFAYKSNTNTSPTAGYGGRDRREVDKGDFEETHAAVYGGAPPDGRHICGQGGLGGTSSVTYEGCLPRTMIHEVGHNLTLHHANDGFPDKLESYEYKDETSVMGSNGNNPGLNAPDMIFLGVTTDREIRNVTQTEQVILRPTELPESGLKNGEYKYAVIEKGENKYVVSIRKKKGIHWHVGRAGGHDHMKNNYVYVHRMEPMDHKRSALINPMIQAGEQMDLLGDIRVEAVEYQDEAARVNIYYNLDDETPSDLIIDQSLPKRENTLELNEAFNGIWYNSNMVGQGIDLHIKNDRQVMYWYTFGMDSNMPPTFIYSDEDGNLYRTEYGYFDDPTVARNVHIGTYSIEALAPNRIVFDYDTIDYGRGSIMMKPILTNQDERSGILYPQGKEGSGFSVQFRNDTCVMYWYTYGQSRTNFMGGQIRNNQQWFLCQGERKEDGTYDLTIYNSPENVLFCERVYENELSDLEVLGTANYNPETNEFIYNLDRYNRAGSYNLVRLL